MLRTCIGCRRVCPAAELLRLALVDGRPTVDSRRRLPGRGASLHPARACIAQALARGAFQRAFRGPTAPVTAEDLFRDIEQR